MNEEKIEENEEEEIQEITWRLIVIRFGMMFILLSVALFLPAGTIEYWQGWAYVGTTVLFTFIGRAQIMVKDPDMLTERISATSKDDVAGWDKVIVQYIAVLGPLIMLLVAGLDFGNDWTQVQIPLWLQLVSLTIIVLSIFLANWAMMVNRFFSSVIRIQTDRNHVVVKDGPYRVIRHPGYAASFYANIFTPLLLGSLWAYIPVAFLMFSLFFRLVMEEKVLHEQLDGYTEYAQETRYRIIPYVY